MNGGAVIYLAQSNYGRSGTEITINDYYTNEQTESPFKTVVTGLTSSDSSEEKTRILSNVSAYNTINGMKGSSTGNITGVYDLSGGLWERVSGYISDGSSQLTSNGTNSTYGSSGSLMGTNFTANPNGYQSLSTRTYTIYPYNSTDDNSAQNYTAYKGLLSSTYDYGDSILETSTGGADSTSWNSDHSYFAYTASPLFQRGGTYHNGSNAGSFAFYRTSGSAHYDSGFRAVLVAE